MNSRNYEKLAPLVAVSIAALVFALRGLVPSVHASSGFTNASIGFAYGYNADGFAFNHPVAVAGKITFDGTTDGNGNGSFHLVDVVNLNGAITNRDFTGSYHVNSDGTGTMTFVQFDGVVKSRFFVIVDGGNEIRFVEADPSGDAVTQGTLKKQ